MNPGPSNAAPNRTGNTVHLPTSRPPSDPSGPDTGDLEYDLAHENVDSGVLRLPSSHPAAGIDVATRTGDYLVGDYGYDLAHDNPGR